MTDFDFSQLSRLAADLGELPNFTRKPLRQAIEVTARRVKDTWNGKLYNAGHASRTGHAITYDLKGFEGFGATILEAEIGAERGSGRQAGIVRLLENGSVNNAPHGYGSGALQENEADFEHGIALAVEAAGKAAGL